jgi:hypothetical protein
VVAWFENKAAAVTSSGELFGREACLASDCPSAGVMVLEMSDIHELVMTRDKGAPEAAALASVKASCVLVMHQ